MTSQPTSTCLSNFCPHSNHSSLVQCSCCRSPHPYLPILLLAQCAKLCPHSIQKVLILLKPRQREAERQRHERRSSAGSPSYIQQYPLLPPAQQGRCEGVGPGHIAQQSTLGPWRLWYRNPGSKIMIISSCHHVFLGIFYS